jgi:hypothetical protein
VTLLREQARVDQRGGDVRRELAQNRDVALRVAIPLAAEHVQDANRFRLVDQRHRERGVHARHDADVAGIGGDVTDDERLLRRHDASEHPVRQAELSARRVLRISNRVAELEHLTLFADEIDRKGVERNQPSDQFRDARQQLVELDDRRDLPAEIEQRQQDVALVPRQGRRRWLNGWRLHERAGRTATGIILAEK